MENINENPNDKFLTGLTHEEERDLADAEVVAGSAELGAPGNELDSDALGGLHIDADMHTESPIMQ